MNFKVTTIPYFVKQLKRLSKKYRSIPVDYENFLTEIEKNPQIGTPIGENCYKTRMAISSKNKGKSGGARVISYVYIKNEMVYLLSIYDKSEQESLHDAEIKTLLESLGLE